MTQLDSVREFHDAYGMPVITIEESLFRKVPSERVRLRLKLIVEELDELMTATLQTSKGYIYKKITPYIDACGTRIDHVEVADALGDLLYVINGMALELGIPLDDVFEEIHRSNMSKLGEDGKPIYRDDGKILKGPNFIEPDLFTVLFQKLEEEVSDSNSKATINT